MSSFLQNGSEGALSVFSAVVNPTLTTAQTLFTSGKSTFLPLYAIARNPNVALQATAAFSVGNTLTSTGNTTNCYVSAKVLTSMSTTECYYAPCFTLNATSGAPAAPAATTFTLTMSTTDSTATTMTVDVIGYCVG